MFDAVHDTFHSVRGVHFVWRYILEDVDSTSWTQYTLATYKMESPDRVKSMWTRLIRDLIRTNVRPPLITLCLEKEGARQL